MEANLEARTVRKSALAESDYIVEKHLHDLSTEARAGANKNLVDWWRIHHQEVTNFAVLVSVALTFIGVVYAYHQLKSSSINFQEELKEQQRSTAAMLVSDFFNQVGDIGIALNSINKPKQQERSQSPLDKLIVSRAQLLLEELETDEQRGKVVRFLATDEHRRLFQPNPNDPKQRYINLYNVKLSNVNLSGAVFTGSFIHCTIFRESILDEVEFGGSTIMFTDMSHTQIGHANFTDTRINSSSLNGSKIFGPPRFDGAVIENSDISNISLGADLIDTLIGDQANSHKMSDMEKNHFALAELLKNVKSLAGSKIDPGMAKALYAKVGPSQFRRVLPWKTFDANAWSFTLDENNPNCDK